MVTGKEEPQSPPIPPPSSSRKDTNAPPFDQGKTDYGGGKLEGLHVHLSDHRLTARQITAEISHKHHRHHKEHHLGVKRRTTETTQIQTVRQYMVELTGIRPFLHNQLT
ncbi:hypothetical protein LXL04_032006 [Taraxacum kok-saghyz]